MLNAPDTVYRTPMRMLVFVKYNQWQFWIIAKGIFFLAFAIIAIMQMTIHHHDKSLAITVGCIIIIFMLVEIISIIGGDGINLLKCILLLCLLIVTGVASLFNDEESIAIVTVRATISLVIFYLS